MKEQPKVIDRVVYLGERICLIDGVKGKRGVFFCFVLFFKLSVLPILREGWHVTLPQKAGRQPQE